MTKELLGRLKFIEAGVILKMVEDAFHHQYFIIDVIVSNNDRTMQAVLKHPSIGARCKVLKSSKGKLDEEIPVPSFLADPYHHVKVVAKNIFPIVNSAKAQRCVFTKSDALELNKYWGYIINSNRNKSLE